MRLPTCLPGLPSIRRTVAVAIVALTSACAERTPTGVEQTPRIGASVTGDEEGQDVCVGDADVCAAPATLAAEAVAFTGRIRIGVVPSAEVVHVGGSESFEVRDKVTGVTLFTGSGAEAAVSLSSSVPPYRSRRLQVTCTPTVADRDAKLAAGAAKGYPTYTEFIVTPTIQCWRVYIGERPLWPTFPRAEPAEYVTAEAEYKSRVVADGLAPADAFWRTVTISGVVQYKVDFAGVTKSTLNPVVVTPVGGYVTIDGRRYRGTAEVRANSSATPAGINELPIEEYLYGVVPRELGPVAFPELEALKAQAVAARTYAITNLGKRGADGYDLLPTTSDQVYGGYEDEHPLSTRAVDETEGIVATYGGKPIEALYSSTSGGFTANNEESFNSAPVPYLRGVPDHERGQALEHVPTLEVFKNHANPQSLRAVREGDFESDWSRYHRWTFEWTAEEIRAVLSAYAGSDVGRVLSIDVLERGPSGRALRIAYVTESGTYYDTKDHIRSSLKYINAAGVPSNLLSTLFFVEPVLDRRTKAVVGFRAYGGGWGHGVGMSQTGAVGMAEKKATYDEILRHYYRGIELGKY
jgi:stage II sporulation protein D